MRNLSQETYSIVPSTTTKTGRRKTGLSPSSQIFLLSVPRRYFLWIICVIYVLFLWCFRICLLLHCGHLRGRADVLALVCDVYCDFVTFRFGMLGQVWYLIVSIPYPSCGSYFYYF